MTDRDRPIARILPVRTAAPSVRIIPANRPFSEVRDKPHPRARWSISLVDLLLEERRKR